MDEAPKRSKHFLEAACLYAIRTGWPAATVTGVEIVRLKPKVAGPNWRVGEIIPEQKGAADAKIRTLVAHLPAKWTVVHRCRQQTEMAKKSFQELVD